MCYEWIEVSGGTIPGRAEPHGREGPEDGGYDLWVAVADHSAGTHPGKVRPGFGCALIPYGRKELKVHAYKILMNQGNWEKGEGDSLPDARGAVEAGREADGTIIYVARAHYKGGIHPGKVRHGFGGAMIPYDGKEVLLYEYEILMQQ